MADKKYLAELARSADRIFREELGRSGVEYDFAELRVIDAPRVGVMGDERSYEYAAMVEIMRDGRHVTSSSLMEIIGTRIPNEVRGINTVVYALARKERI